MNFDFLAPVADEVLAAFQNDQFAYGHEIQFHTATTFPDLENVKIALLGVCESRVNPKESSTAIFNEIRKKLYGLYAGNWDVQVADIGDIYAGDTPEDTYFAFQNIIEYLLDAKVIPLILGGSQELVYYLYRAYDNRGMVNYVNVDARFDIGNAEQPISTYSYVGKMIMDEPYNLFNYANIGYQTYFCPQEEIGLIEKLFFEAYRLGEISKDITLIEPIMRDADMLSIDISSVEALTKGSPNGFSNREACALSRYAGIGDRLTSFGIFQLYDLEKTENNSMLVSQMLWYFIEGVNYRKHETDILKEGSYLRYAVPVEDVAPLTFYKSTNSGRWWIEIPFSTSFNNKLKKTTLLSCSYQDYLDACNQAIPERWYKAKRKNEV